MGECGQSRSAGVDGVTLEQMKARGWHGEFRATARGISHKSYRPQAVRRVYTRRRMEPEAAWGYGGCGQGGADGALLIWNRFSESDFLDCS